MTVRKLYLALILVLLFAWAIAQVVPPPDLDPSNPRTWFLSAAGWGFMTMFILNLVKTNWWPDLRGSKTILVSAAIAIGGSLLAGTGLFAFANINLEGNIAELLTFGIAAFIASSGGWDTAKRFKAQPSGVQAVVDVTANPTANITANNIVRKEARPPS